MNKYLTYAQYKISPKIHDKPKEIYARALRTDIYNINFELWLDDDDAPAYVRSSIAYDRSHIWPVRDHIYRCKYFDKLKPSPTNQKDTFK